MDHLEGLNQAQKEAVLATEGPVLVLAGAGAGKTRTIAHRIVHLVKSGVPGRGILAITFTNKAAREMRERVSGLLKEHGETGAVRGVTVLTFHALAVQLLREFAQDIGLSKHFVIYDRTDSLRAIKKAMKEAGEAESGLEPRTILGTISRAKGDAITLGAYREQTGNAYYQLVVATVWERYHRALRAENALDFDDLLLELWRLLTGNEHVRERLQDRFRYLHIDEYQDTNKVQYEIVRLLSGEAANVFCVGDLDQNVYTWRGSTIENILAFEQSFPHATVLKLEQNYRSTGTIVTVSNDIIKKNVRRKEKTLFTTNPEGDKLHLFTGYDERHEAEQVVTTIEELLQQGTGASEIAVLYRANFQSRVLEDAFLGAGVPYRVLGTRFYDRKEVKDVLAYIRAALNPGSRVDIERIINTPARGIGKITLAKLFEAGQGALTGRTREKVDAFYGILARIRTAAEHKVASEALAVAIDASGLGASLSQSSLDEDRERLENVKELVSLASTRYDELPAPDGLLRLLEDAALATDQDELDQRTRRTSDAVALMTIHAAKGLEFAHVFITGLEDGIFPHERQFGGTQALDVDDEEERRLFYVALTRAKAQVHLSYAQVRTVFGQRSPRVPSEFILDIDESFIDTASDAQPSTVVYLD